MSFLTTVPTESHQGPVESVPTLYLFAPRTQGFRRKPPAWWGEGGCPSPSINPLPRKNFLDRTALPAVGEGPTGADRSRILEPPGHVLSPTDPPLARAAAEILGQGQRPDSDQPFRDRRNDEGPTRHPSLAYVIRPNFAQKGAGTPRLSEAYSRLAVLFLGPPSGCLSGDRCLALLPQLLPDLRPARGFSGAYVPKGPFAAPPGRLRLSRAAAVVGGPLRAPPAPTFRA